MSPSPGHSLPRASHDLPREDLDTIRAMFSYMRPAGSPAEQAFVDRFLTPLGFKRDPFNNLWLQIGEAPTILWSSHVDTVHYMSGTQAVRLSPDNHLRLAKKAKAGSSNCLGADCTAGVWLMTEMVKAGIEGLYVIHHGEEKGCIGSRALARWEEAPMFFRGINAAIAFDRMGYGDVVTHQMGRRTASDAFAFSLAKVLGSGYAPDDSGVYTDTNEYAGLVPECTNVSVGYFGQHGRSESQNVEFLIALRDALLVADWSQLVIARDHRAADDDGGGSFSKRKHRTYDFDAAGGELRTMEDVVAAYPDIVADILQQYGYDKEGLVDEISSYYQGRSSHPFDDWDDNHRYGGLAA